MAEGKVTDVPSLVGTTTNELVGVNPTADDIDSNVAIVELAKLKLPYVSLTTL
jgi:hypothetical protein